MTTYLSRHDQNSIFGRTYQGVPNPQIPFEHAYPTRYHGPIYNVPRFGMPFEPNPMAVPPFSGTSDGGQGIVLSASVGILLNGLVSGLIGYGVGRLLRSL